MTSDRNICLSVYNAMGMNLCHKIDNAVALIRIQGQRQSAGCCQEPLIIGYESVYQAHTYDLCRMFLYSPAGCPGLVIPP